MARNNAPQRPAGDKARRPGRGKTRTTGTAAAPATSGAEYHESVLPEWDEVPEDLSVIPDFEGLAGKPAANHGNDAEARRRIERLREERLLQQALSDVFDL
jgi:hypothetical protein